MATTKKNTKPSSSKKPTPAKKPAPSKKSAPVKKPVDANSQTAPAGGGDVEEFGSQEAFEQFLPAAKAIPAHEVLVFRADDGIVYNNVQRGVKNIVGIEGEIRNLDVLKRLAVDPQELRTLPRLTQGFLFAKLQVNRAQASDGTIDALLEEGYPLRRQMLATANVLADKGLIPDGEVAPIRPGSGKADTANDLVLLAALLKKHKAKIQGKHPITDEEIARAGVIGSKLQTLVKTSGAKVDRNLPEAVQKNVDLCNRFWTLVTRRHTLLWKVGAWIHAQAVDEFVPPLLSRQVGPRKKGEKSGEGEGPK